MANEVNCDGMRHGSNKEIKPGEQVYCKDCYDALFDKISDLEDEIKELECELEGANNRAEELEEELDDMKDAKKEI
jgi:predicted  nucleic acid-binding Zn-ribbon protein